MVGALGATLLVLALLATPAAAHHSYDMDCPSFSSQASAQYHMNAHPGDPDGLDGNDDDGRACESNPCPCYYGGATQPEPLPPPPPPAPAPAPPPPIAQPQPQAKRYSARIVSVTDGDTIRVRLRSGARRIVRLIGIDTPESRKPGVPVECRAKSATNYMTQLAFRRRGGRKLGHSVRLTTDPTQDRSRQIWPAARLRQPALRRHRSRQVDDPRRLGDGLCLRLQALPTLRQLQRDPETRREQPPRRVGVLRGRLPLGAVASSTKPGSGRRLVRSPELPAWRPPGVHVPRFV